MEENENLYAPIAILAILVIASALIVVFHRAEREYAAEAETASECSTADEAEGCSESGDESESETTADTVSREYLAKTTEKSRDNKRDLSETKRDLSEITTEHFREVTKMIETTTEAYYEESYEENYDTGGHGSYIGYFTLTAYEWTGEPMANGEYPYYGVCASNYFALGTVLYIDGYGTFTVKDRGGPSMGYDVIDIYLGDEDACWEFGVRTAEVYYG